MPCRGMLERRQDSEFRRGVSFDSVVRLVAHVAVWRITRRVSRGLALIALASAPFGAVSCRPFDKACTRSLRARDGLFQLAGVQVMSPVEIGCRDEGGGFRARKRRLLIRAAWCARASGACSSAIARLMTESWMTLSS